MQLMQTKFQFELVLYIFVWSCVVLYSIFCFALKAENFFQDYNDDYSDFAQGWGFLSRKKDSADYEWQTIKFLIEKIYIWIIVSAGLSEILRKFQLITQLKLWQISVTTIFIVKELGPFPLLMIWFQPILFTLAFKRRSKLIIWLFNGLSLFLISLYKQYSSQEEFLIIFKLDGYRAYLIILAIFWMNLRCVSYYLDLLSVPDEQQTFLNFLSYCFYLPTAFCGPFIPYKDFKNCYRSDENFLLRLYGLLFQVCRFTFWSLFVEFCLHFIYVNAAGFHPEWVTTLSSWSLYGYGYTMGQFFHIKYLVIYGFATSFAKFENVTVPTLPVCIGRIHRYSDMWRYFDAGLYNFLLRYIYIPCIKNRFIQNRLVASLLCFIFVYVWHGLEDYIMIWSLINYIAIISENFGDWLNKTYLQKTFLVQKVGPLWFRRVSCMVASPLLALSAIANFYFFARTEIGNIFLLRFINDNFITNMYLLAMLYCCCQISTELRLRRNIAQQVTGKKKE